ncbi:MAG: hypothetical protein ABI861_09200 [Panacibacter sp.]
MPSSKTVSDQYILFMLAENNLKSWENLYDKYAPVMYAVICNLTDNKAVAAEILTEAFMQVKQKQILLKSIFLPAYTC